MSAILSTCGKYRYTLSRTWLGGSAYACWVLLNPSTADAENDDPTIRRCIRFAQRWGYAGIHVVNLFAFRSTDPWQLQNTSDPIGSENDRYILEAAQSSDIVIFGWGNRGCLFKRDTAIMALLKNSNIASYALGLTKANCPRHPLYLRSDSIPTLFITQ